MESIETRLARLEREVRRWRVAGALVLVLLLGGLFAAAALPGGAVREVKTQRLDIVTGSGLIKARLDGLGLRIYDVRQELARLTGSGIAFYDDEGHVLKSLWVERGSP